MKTLTELTPFARAYIEALYFTNAGPDDEIPADAELSPEALARIETDCAAFLEMAGELPECSRGTGEYTNEEQAGHDFWLTRNGHGAGFWDGDWPEADGKRLTALCKLFGESWPYLGDDGMIHP